MIPISGDPSSCEKCMSQETCSTITDEQSSTTAFPVRHPNTPPNPSKYSAQYGQCVIVPEDVGRKGIGYMIHLGLSGGSRHLQKTME